MRKQEDVEKQGKIIETILRENDRMMSLADLSEKFRIRTGDKSRKTIYRRLKERQARGRIIMRKEGTEMYIILAADMDIQQILNESVSLSLRNLQYLKANYDDIPTDQRAIILTSLLASLLCDKHNIWLSFFNVDEQYASSVQAALDMFDVLSKEAHAFVIEKCKQDSELAYSMGYDFAELSYSLLQNIRKLNPDHRKAEKRN